MDLSNFFPTSRTPVPLSGPGTAVANAGGGQLVAPGTSLVPSGPRIIDGEWSEVPRALAGPASRALTSRAASAIAKLMGGAGAGGTLDALLGPIGALIAAGDGRPNNSASDLQGLTAAYAAARHPAVPAGVVTRSPIPSIDPGVRPPFAQPDNMPQVAQAPPQAPPQPPQQGNNIPWWANAQGANFNPRVPMPMARPAAAPQPPGPPMNIQSQAQQQTQSAPMMNFFQRNTALMKDPQTGAYIDPQAAAIALAQMKS